MPQTETHTPTDWHIDPASDGETIAIRDPVANMYAIIQIDLRSEIGGQTDAKAEAMAKTILTAVNSHAALVKVCEAAEKFIGARLLLTNDDARKVLDQLQAALTKAGKERS